MLATAKLWLALGLLQTVRAIGENPVSFFTLVLIAFDF
jgi:hypothetical protein